MSSVQLTRLLKAPVTQLVLVTAGFLIIRLMLLREPWNSDDLRYFEFASRLLEGRHPLFSIAQTPIVSHQALRFGIILPTALSIAVFGYNYLAYYLPPLLFATAGFLLVQRIAREWLPTGAVLALALVHAVLTFEITHSSALFTDLASAALALGFLYYLHRITLSELSGRRLWLHAGVASMLALWAYLMRTNQLLLLGPPALLLLLDRQYRRATLIAFGLTGFGVLLEQLFYLACGGGIGYRWQMVRVALQEYMPHFELIPAREYLIRGFLHAWKQAAVAGLLFHAAGLGANIWFLFRSRQTFLRALAAFGLGTYCFFNLYIFRIEWPMLRVMNSQDRFFQAFTYTSLILLGVALHRGASRLQDWMTSLVEGSTAVRGIQAAFRSGTLVVIGLFIVSFGSQSFESSKRLGHRKNSYRNVLAAIGNELERTNQNHGTVFGPGLSLRAIRIFTRTPQYQAIEWRARTYHQLRSAARSRKPNLVLIDQYREPIYRKEPVEVARRRMLALMHDIALSGYSPLYHDWRLSLFHRDAAGKRHPVDFPNMDWQTANIASQEIPGWTIPRQGKIQLARGPQGRLELRCDVDPAKGLYLSSGEPPGFSAPPSQREQYAARPNTRYLFRLVTEIEGDLKVGLWMIEYDDARRVGHNAVNLHGGENSFQFTTGPEARTFRVLYRLAGRGRLRLERFDLVAFEPDRG